MKTASMAMCSSPLSNEIGRSSSKEINTIIPPTADSVTARTVSLMNGPRRRKPIIAPTGSARPEDREYKKAFFLLFVA